MNTVPRKSQWLLVTVLAVAFGFMTAITIQQSHTIDAQRGLIHQLFKDSMRLNAMRLQQQPARHVP